MNFEKLRNITTPIEAEDNEAREEKLNEKIEQISLVYAHKKWQEVKEKIPDYKFSEALKFYSPTENIILKPVFNLDGFDFNKYKDKIDTFLNDLYKEVDELTYSGEINFEELLVLINLKKNSIVEYLGLGDLKKYEQGGDKKETKIVKFNELTDVENANNSNYKILPDLGFSKSDKFLEVHFDNFFRTNVVNLGPELIKDDLAKLAEMIVKEKPEIAAIIGQSWLLSTPIAGRLGFKRIEDNSNQQNNFSTWLQFVDRHGQIDQKRFDKFLETSELPFKSVKAYIPVEEFLKMYLPENLRGKVVLKEIDKNKEEEFENIANEMTFLRNVWDDLINSGSDFESLISYEILNKALNLLSQEDRDKFLVFLKKMFEQGVKMDDLNRYQDSEIIEINQKINQKMRSGLYRDREIIV